MQQTLVTDHEYAPGFTGSLFRRETVSRTGILVLHGGTGITDHERSRARTLAELGYAAFVPNIFGEPFRDRAHGMSVITHLVENPPVLRARLAAALQCLRDHARVVTVAAVGFCFGGLAALELARSGAELSCAASFHGGLSTRAPAEPSAVRARVLVCTGAADPFVSREQRDAFEAEMTAAGAQWQLTVYGGVQHGFTEHTQRAGCAYDRHADQDSWRAFLASIETE